MNNANSCKYLIFLPVRNGAVYIKSAIQSILDQTFNDLRVVILDNFSSDNTVNIVKSFQDPRILLITTSVPLSIEKNWQRIYSFCSEGLINSEYVSIIGHDDMLCPDFLQTIDELVEKHPQASIYHTHFYLIDTFGNRIRPSRPIPEFEDSNEFLLSRGWGIRDSYGTGYVFKRSDFIKVGGFPLFPKLIYSDDIFIARMTAINGKICSPKYQFSYRLHRNSASANFSRKRIDATLQSLLIFLKEIKYEFPDYWNSPKGKYAISYLIAREGLPFRHLYLSYFLSDDSRFSLEELNNIYTELSDGTRFNAWGIYNRFYYYTYNVLRKTFWFFVFFKSSLRDIFNSSE